MYKNIQSRTNECNRNEMGELENPCQNCLQLYAHCLHFFFFQLKQLFTSPGQRHRAPLRSARRNSTRRIQQSIQFCTALHTPATSTKESLVDVVFGKDDLWQRPTSTLGPGHYYCTSTVPCAQQHCTKCSTLYHHAPIHYNTVQYCNETRLSPVRRVYVGSLSTRPYQRGSGAGPPQHWQGPWQSQGVVDHGVAPRSPPQ